LFSGNIVTQASNYRPDIDGLRAIAVLTVVFYHYGVAPFTGGFVGVDVFFVISGYLITRNLFSDLRDNSFSLMRFYDRRFRRILPALLVVLAACLALGYVLLLPGDYARLGESGVYAAFGLSNFFFLWHSDYFDAAAEMQPLLHTWSLAVEEQFYLFWPLIMWSTLRLGKSTTILLAVLSVMAIASFAAAVYWAEHDQPLAFFMLPTRAWELAVGAALVFAPVIKSRAVAETMGWLGLALICYAVIILDSSYLFPGWNALYPCLGAALLVWPKEGRSIPSQLLSLKPAVQIGLISYSLYLWHWPVLVFFRHYTHGAMPDGPEASMLIAASVVAAWASLRWVERPARNMRSDGSTHRRSVVLGAAGMTVLGASSFYVSWGNGLPWRVDQQARHYLSYDGYIPVRRGGGCTVREVPVDGSVHRCLERLTGKPRILIIGDSYATQLDEPILARSRDERVRITVIGNNGCRPVLDSIGPSQCTSLMALTFSEFIEQGDYDAVILAARWRNGQHDKLRETVEKILLSVDNVYVVGQPLEYQVGLPTLLASESLPRRNHDLTNFARYAEVLELETRMKDALEGLPVVYVSPLEALCGKNGVCRTVTDDGTPIQFDYGHLTPEGAQVVVDRLFEQGLLKGVLRTRNVRGT
jgi:peptidoglycan/LPS O-acetylase OafA/YrhL